MSEVFQWGGQLSINTVVVVVGWIIGGLVVVAGMRQQIHHLATELGLLRTTLLGMTATVNKVATDVAYLQGLVRGRSDLVAARLNTVDETQPDR